jgi:heme/copper-type cytochrome/quinol oxidase subunit 3
MIQRIQSVYILLFALIIFSALFFPFAIISVVDEVYILKPASGWEISSGNIDLENSSFYVGYLVAVSFSVLMIVNYKKRKKQLKYGKICYLIVILTLCYMINVVYEKFDLLVEDNVKNLSVLFSASMYMLVVSLPIMFLANRAIKKDENLVKSLDRLR